MNILFSSSSGGLLSLALRVKEEGHHPYMVSSCRSGQGMIPSKSLPIRLPGPELDPTSAFDKGMDLSILEGTEKVHTEMVVGLRKKGIPTIGPNPFSISLRESKGREASFAFANIRTSPVYPIGELLLDESWEGGYSLWWKATTLEERQPLEDLLQLVEHNPGLGELKISPTPIGHRFLIGSWFDGHSFVEPYLYYHPCFRPFEGNQGPMTEEPCALLGKPLFQITKLLELGIKRIEPLLCKSDYRGPFFLEGWASENQITWTRSFTNMSLMFPSLEAVGNLTGVLSSVARGEGRWKLRSEAWLVGICAYVHEQRFHPIILESHSDHFKHVRPGPMIMEGASYRPIFPLVGMATAWGKDLNEAKRRATRSLDLLKVPGLQYRSDILQGVESGLESLKRWGWI